jgi:uncharacterized damage-inducible protein DinB
MDAAAHYLQDMTVQFRKLKDLADKAITQLPDEELFASTGDESNSIAIVMRHVAGNLRSRFTDFLTTDGEKPDRKRDGEFEMPPGTSRETLAADWEAGFARLETALAQLTPADLLREVAIRGERHTVVQALNRALAHLGYHVGQIVGFARQHRGANWRTLSIPRGQSDSFNGPRRF